MYAYWGEGMEECLRSCGCSVGGMLARNKKGEAGGDIKSIWDVGGYRIGMWEAVIKLSRGAARRRDNGKKKQL